LLRSGDVVEEGEWVEGVLTGKWTYPDGRTLEGEFRGQTVEGSRNAADPWYH
jgi:hypothetical protein